ncbi:MAG: metallophosphoesterase [Spirochaetes bacterium]|nr:metallophosphoesterase [Spirochaetota bacterium]
MKIINFIVFLSVILAIYGSINFYIFVRGWQAFARSPGMKAAYLTAFFFLATSFFIARIIENYKICLVSDIYKWIGSFWIGIMVYLLLGIIVIDILRSANHLINFFPDALTRNHENTKLIAGILVIIISMATVIAGYINARSPVLKKVEFSIPKTAGSLKTLRIAMASDIHLGTIISNSRLSNLVNIINKTEPDIILFPGDIVDEDLAPVIKNNLGETLVKLKSKYGTYAVTGNHEFIGGAEAAVKYLEDHNITVLRDRVAKVNHSFYIAGRDDLSSNRFSGKSRKTLEELLDGIDCSLPVILMDHQPFALKKTAETCVDLQLSGHTHNGQLWPVNFIISLIYELGKGHMKIGNTHFYVSSGYGTWGPPIRTNSRPEIIEFTLHFK